MDVIKMLPENCVACICHQNNLRSCRKYDCSDFPVHERVCAGIEFDMNVQKSLARYEMRLKSSCRAAKEHMEAALLKSADEITDEDDDMTEEQADDPDTENYSPSAADASDIDIPWTEED